MKTTRKLPSFSINMGNIMSNNMSSLHSSNGGLCEVDDPWDLYRGAKGIDEVDVHRRLWRKAKEDNILSSNNMTLPTDDESHHEIEILGEGPEGAESQNQWENCKTTQSPLGKGRNSNPTGSL
ncbi:hypothetical protein RRG08_050743 [Elysia crispata]|uniref:Uncharacterized protein n=1 Tax=Elysia crispata TaxID=231223 RepID=A0AAE0ZSN0_9GAST|nr:hypothetical protein RRG08_050743 [Elysia crispata]